MMKKESSPVGQTWDDSLDRELFTPEEIEESDLRVAIISELISARNAGKISQKQLEALSGVKQPVIARIEKGHSSPRLDTILKLLRPLGKTLAVVPIKE